MGLGDRFSAALNGFYSRVRDRRAWSVARREAEARAFDALRGHKYCLVVTYRRSDEGIPTPGWFGLAEGRLYFRTEADAGKVKRIRANGRARVAPANARGRPLGPAADGTARILPPEEEGRAEAALRANYGLGRRLYEAMAMNLGPAGVYVEIVPVGATDTRTTPAGPGAERGP